MTPAAARAMYARQIDQHGEAMTLSRGATTQAVVGRIIHQVRVSEDLTDTVSQRNLAAVILAEDLDDLTPLRGDRLTIGTKTFVVETVDDYTRRIAGELIAYELALAG